MSNRLPVSAPESVAKQRSRWISYEVGIVPLPIFLTLFVLVASFILTHTLTSEVSFMIVALAVGGNACAWIGGLVPWLRRLGAPAITAAFLPSYMIYRHWLPAALEHNVTVFVRSTNFIYLYIAAVIVGSIAGMNRPVLLRGIAKLFAPLLVGTALAICLGSAVGISLRMPLIKVIPMILIPIMAGGVGEGAIPLSMGYAEIFHQSASDLLAHLLPVVLFANFVAIVCSGILNTIGEHWPSLTGNGALENTSHKTVPPHAKPLSAVDITPQRCLSGLLFSLSLYLAGVVLHRWLTLPPPVTMILLAVALKMLGIIPAWLERAAMLVGRFFVVTVTYPLLFAVAVALTPWAAVKEALHPANLLLITIAVLALTTTGFLMARLLGMFPVETALVNACHTGSGGTGDVAILTAANRLELMSFAQVATRIGGALTVTVTLIVLRWLMRGR